MNKDTNLIPAVQNKLIKPDHAQHFLKMHDYVGDCQTVLYNAMGPDIITPLLIANAEHVIGVDIEPFFSAQVKIDQAMNGKIAKQERYMNGYWNEDMIRIYGIGALAGEELMSMAVAKTEMEAFSSGIIFPWKHPDDNAPKDRTVRYLKPEDAIDTKVDMILQKSLPDISGSVRFLSKLYKEKLKQDGLLLVGHPLYREDTLLCDMRHDLGKETCHFSSPDAYASYLVAWKK